ncbi:MAG: hypothetical protein HC821_01035, partial [Lewinella sp.]|nr:hypothetical protein [Lewinella sp.]
MAINQLQIQKQQIILRKNISHSSRKIDTKGGNYVESIAGNYFDQRVTIQGYEVDVSKGISEIAEQLRQIELCLQKQGENAEKIRSRIIDDLREQAYTNSKLEEELLEWVNEQDSSVQINTDVAIDIFAKQIFSYSRDQLNNSIDVPSGRYQRIYELLQNK